MNYYDEQLRNLQNQVGRKNKLESSLKSLYSQKKELEEKVAELEKIKLSEQKDVDKLEKGRLSAFFYEVIGKKEEKLDKERQEAYAAAAKYHSSVQELEYVNDSILSEEKELKQIMGCENSYKRLLEEKKALIKDSGNISAREILDLEEQVSSLNNQKKEIKEAKNAGIRARGKIENVCDALDSAESLGTWDAFGGDGIFLHMAKHDELDKAQSAIELLQVELRKFKTELADVHIDTDLKVNLDDFTRFADWFFDNIFTDFKVLDQIYESQAKMRRIDDEICSVLRGLEQKEKSVDTNISVLQRKIEGIVLQTTI